MEMVLNKLCTNVSGLQGSMGYEYQAVTHTYSDEKKQIKIVFNQERETIHNAHLLMIENSISFRSAYCGNFFRCLFCRRCFMFLIFYPQDEEATKDPVFYLTIVEDYATYWTNIRV